MSLGDQEQSMGLGRTIQEIRCQQAPTGLPLNQTKERSSLDKASTTGPKKTRTLRDRWYKIRDIQEAFSRGSRGCVRNINTSEKGGNLSHP